MSIPCRYIHSASEMVDIRDVEHGVQLITKIMETPYQG
jgi:putative aminopeptidase FrvX